MTPPLQQFSANTYDHR